MTSLPETLNGDNLAFVEALYASYRQDPAAVPAVWQPFLADLAAQDAAAGNGNGSSPASPTAISERVPFLMGLRLFRGVPAEEVAQLAGVAREEEYQDGAYLFHQGDAGDALFVVLDGSVVIWRDAHISAELGIGNVVGELGVLDRAPRVADAIARGRTRVLRLRGDDLLGRLDHRPALARGLIQGLTHRLRERGSRQDKVDQLIRSYRVRGHLVADLNPLAPPGEPVPELELAHWGLSERDLDSLFSSITIPGTTYLTLREILARLRDSYCGSIGVQYMHIDALEPKLWLQRRLEDPGQRRVLSRAEQLHILTKLTDAEIFEQFIHKKFLGAKRFSAEGAETLIPLLDQAIDEAAGQGVEEIVIGMAHRGRLNVMANILNKSPAQIFREFEDADAERYFGRGDVKYHLGHSSDRTTSGGVQVHLSLCFNPSHLEFVGPVVLGRVRAKQDRRGDLQHRRVMGLVIHGDAAFAGQGVVQEMLNMSGLAGYKTGGTLHVIVNNQIGFTTPPESGRSSRYATDVGKMLQSPIFHVNGEHPEAVAQVLRLAMDYRRTFDSDVIIDMYCYRRYGHNESDEPSFTQPLLYEQIRQRKSVREGYLDSLLQLGGVSREEAEQIAVERRQRLEAELGRARDPAYAAAVIEEGKGLWQGYRGGADHAVAEVDTALPREVAAQLLHVQTQLPADFTPNPKIRTLLQAREAMAAGERPLDWGAGEALALASLLVEGTRVRLSGQDTGRGTFSHRHAVLYDFRTGATYTPLQHLAASQAPFEVWDSPLSEIAPVGFEYGYSLDCPDGLILWEAQFGDFCNVAQVIIDQFLSSGEDKWHRLSGLVMLLPHGFEGQGPEHSSARLERFLSLCAEDNLQVVNLTTPAQLWHCLRRQVRRPLRKPLIVMSPKSLLRLKEAVSSLDELATGSFQRVIPDSGVAQPAQVRRILLCSGKVYYDLAAARQERDVGDVAIVRLEQLYPLSPSALAAALAPYPPAVPVVWVQEEPRNMGAFGFLQQHLTAELLGGRTLLGVTRPASASPATGSATAHKHEQAVLLDRAFSPD